MAVVIEAYNLVIRNAAVESRFPEGMIAFEADCPNRTFCTDGLICRIGFTALPDLFAYVAHLQPYGFIVPGPEGSPEMAIVDAQTGLHFPCEWLVLEEIPYAGDSLTVALVPGTDPSSWVAPEGWRLRSFSERMERIHLDDLEYVGIVPDSMVQVHVHRKTGEIIYAGRADSTAQSELDVLRQELAYLLLVEEQKPGSAWKHVGTCYQRAKALALSADWKDVGPPLYLSGVFARLLGNWDRAEAVFRRLTALEPGHLEGWLELTTVLAHRRRFRQAEEAARAALALAPQEGRTLANLAGVLCRTGRLDEARSLAHQAVQASPADRKCRRVLAAVDAAAQRRANPWWRGLWPRVGS
jgi:hypothetical protein